MIRILHVVGIMNTGGIETWLMNVYRHIDRTKIQFDFVVHTVDRKGYYDEEIEKLGGRIIHIPEFRIINIFKYKKTWRELLKRNEYKILHTHIRSMAPIYLKIARQYGIKTISHAHNISNGKFPVSLVKNMFQKNIAVYSDIRLACSNEAGNWLFKKYSFMIIKNAIDASLYILNSKIRDEYRKKYDIEHNVVIGHIGRFSYQKNHNFLLSIFAELYKRNKAFKLVLIGDGELKEVIEKKIQKMNLASSVICTGVRSDIPNLLQMIDIFIFPSLYEGLGIALIEAQAAGLQCFVSDTIPKEAIITDMVNVLSIDEPASKWADKILNIMNTQRENTLSCIQNNGYDIKIGYNRPQPVR
jgi:glycosyltransferase involved in cell wall biosynthesis